MPDGKNDFIKKADDFRVYLNNTGQRGDDVYKKLVTQYNRGGIYATKADSLMQQAMSEVGYKGLTVNNNVQVVTPDPPKEPTFFENVKGFGKSVWNGFAVNIIKG